MAGIMLGAFAAGMLGAACLDALDAAQEGPARLMIGGVLGFAGAGLAARLLRGRG